MTCAALTAMTGRPEPAAAVWVQVAAFGCAALWLPDAASVTAAETSPAPFWLSRAERSGLAAKGTRREPLDAQSPFMLLEPGERDGCVTGWPGGQAA